MTSFQFSAIGTQWQIDINSWVTESKLHGLKEKIFDRIESFDKNYSRFRNDSWVTENSYRKGISSVPDDFDNMFRLYEKLYQHSRGLFTPLIGSVMEQAGYDKNYSLKPKKITSPPALTQSLTYQKKNLEFKKKVLLDFGAAGKGYLVDIISNHLTDDGILDFTIDASGDIRHASKENKTIRVGLEHPNNPSVVIGVCELSNMSICGSSGSRRRWAEFHHTINPKTLTSPIDIIATWVIADSTILSDALATCLFLDPHPQHYKDFNFECVMLYKDNTAFKSDNFPGELFTS